MHVAVADNRGPARCGSSSGSVACDCSLDGCPRRLIEIAADLGHHRGEVPPREVSAERQRVSGRHVVEGRPGAIGRPSLPPRPSRPRRARVDRGDGEHGVIVDDERVVVQVHRNAEAASCQQAGQPDRLLWGRRWSTDTEQHAVAGGEDPVHPHAQQLSARRSPSAVPPPGPSRRPTRACRVGRRRTGAQPTLTPGLSRSGGVELGLDPTGEFRHR